MAAVSATPSDRNSQLIQKLTEKHKKRVEEEKQAAAALVPEEQVEILDYQVRARGDRLFNHHVFSKRERFDSAYIAQPLFHRRYDFCCGKRCSRYEKGTRLSACVSWDEQKKTPHRRLCDYRRCPNPQEHHTQACPTLMRRCGRCGCRGHDEREGCDPNNEHGMSLLTRDYKEGPQEGVYTNRDSAGRGQEGVVEDKL